MSATTYRLDPAMPILLRPDGSAQIGWDPRRAVRVAPAAGWTATALAAVLHRLAAGASAEQLAAEACPHLPPGADHAAIGALIDQLVAAEVAGTVEDPGPRRTPNVRIHGDGPLAQLLYDGLRCADARLARSHAANIAVHPTGTDLVLLADTQVPDPRLARDLTRGGVAHLPVRVRDGRGLVGPLVIPGVTSCLTCADLHRTDRDAAWPVLAAQLRGRVGTADRATLLATAALALRQVHTVLAAVRGSRARAAAPATLSTTLEVDVDAGAIRARHWPRHPGCGC